MRYNPKHLRPLAALLLALACSAGLARAQNLVYSSWDFDVQGWTCGGWTDNGAVTTLSWDSTIDAASNALSGSLRIDGSFPATGNGTLHLQTCQALADFSPYNAVSIDVFVAPGSPPSPGGNYGTLDLRLRTRSWEWPGVVILLGTMTNTGWTHLEGSIPPTTATNFSGANLEWSTTYTNDATIWVDNLTFIMPGIFNDFSTWDTDVQGWGCGDWNDTGVNHTNSWDGTVDAANSPTSGSLKIEATFTSGGGPHVQRCSGLSDFKPYTAMSLDVYVAPGSVRTPGGDFGVLDIRLRTGSWDWPGVVVQFPAVTNEGWTHLEANIPATTATNFAGVDLEWMTTYANAPAVNTIWVDNMRFIGFAAPPPPPRMLMEQCEPGLEVVTSGSGDYSRKNIATVAALASSLPWTNSPDAVTYSMTINETVQAGSAGYAANIMLVGTDSTGINGSPDWNEPNGIFMEARPTAAGTFNVDVRYKTNAPGAHGIRFTPDGLLIQTNTALTSLVGTWAITVSNSVVWLTAPGGVTGQGELPPDVPALFGPNLFALFGAQPYTMKDRKISLSRVHIYGGLGFTGTVDQDFTQQTAIDNNFLEPKEEDPGGVHLKPTNTVARVSWTLPDSGFQLFSSPSLSPASWTASSLGPIPVGARRVTYIPATSVSGNQYYVRLQK